MLVFVSCVEEDDLEEGLSGDTTPAGDTTPSDPTDTVTPSDPTDTGDTTPAEPGDTTPSDTGDTGSTPTDPSDTGDTGTNPSPSPNCSCGGKECGDDGCGNSCGTCPATHTCNLTTNLCVCQPNCAGKLCTDDDGCGGTCGCKSNETCDTDTGACICIPSCDGKECGDNGCGGTCGDCGDEGVCIESAHTCKYCTKITLASTISTYSKASSNRYYKTVKNAYTPNTGNTSIEDKYTISFTTSAGVATGLNVNFDTFDSLGTCEEGMAKGSLCFIIGEDNSRDDGVNPAKVYFTKEGTLTVDEYNSSNGNIKMSLTGLKLGEIEEKIEGVPAHTVRTFVPNGDCLVIEDTTLEYNK